MSSDLPENFLYVVNSNGCWIWAGYCDKNGYARIYDRQQGRIEWAHRYSYETHKGPLIRGMEIDHMCEVTNCVNPAHLQQLTRAQHIRVTMQRAGKDGLHLAAAHLRRLGCTYSEISDALAYAGKSSAATAVKAAIAKGLVAASELPVVSRLSDVEREEIVDLVALGIPQPVIAELYRVHPSQVSRVSRGLTSGHSTARRAS